MLSVKTQGSHLLRAWLRGISRGLPMPSHPPGLPEVFGHPFRPALWPIHGSGLSHPVAPCGKALPGKPGRVSIAYLIEASSNDTLLSRHDV